MQLDAVGFLSKLSGKFVHEVVPVALASVVGILLVNHYSHRAAPPAVVVQPPAPPPAADAVFQALQDEHQLVVDYLRRDADAKRVAASHEDGARDSRAAPSATKDRSAKLRSALTEKSVPLPPARPAAERTAAASDPLPLAPAPSTFPAPKAPGLTQRIASNVAGGSSAVVGAVRDLAVGAYEMPGRALALRLFDDRPDPARAVPNEGP